MIPKPTGQFSIEYLLTALLVLDTRNPRQHPKRQIRQIAWSIRTFGFVVPILIDRNNKVLAGHGRIAAAILIGLEQVPVIRVEHLGEAQARVFSIADNRLCENSEWDDRLLGEIFLELSAIDLDFSLELSGFSVTEIDLRIEGLSSLTIGDTDPADDVPSIWDRPAVSKSGRTWRLRNHQILCADATQATVYRDFMQDRLAHMVFADFPYNVSVQNHVSVNPAVQHPEFAMASGEMSVDEFTRFLKTSMKLLAQHSTDGSLHFLCMDYRHLLEIITAGKDAYTELKNLCVWVKHNGGMGSMYRSQHELVFVYKNGRAPHRNNIELGRHGRNRTNVWNYPGANRFGRSGEEGNLLTLHATPKPIAMIADAILDCTARGDIVLDSFIGIGSTLVAAERVGRICYGIEIEPRFVDTAVRRWQNLTGECAVDAVTGERFDDLAAKAEVGHV